MKKNNNKHDIIRVFTEEGDSEGDEYYVSWELLEEFDENTGAEWDSIIITSIGNEEGDEVLDTLDEDILNLLRKALTEGKTTIE